MLSTLRTDNSPFNEEQLRNLKQSIGTLDFAQAQWLSGFLAGRLAVSQKPIPAVQTEPQPGSSLTILYGSETGNGEAIANELAASAARSGISAELHSLDNFRPAGLRKLKTAVFVMSTHGEGDPPEEALDLFEYLDSERASQLPGLKYRILALGDHSYKLFCQAGRRLDVRLQALGAQPFGERLECDVDYNADAIAWSEEVLEFASKNLDPDSIAPTVPHLRVVHNRPRWSRQQPFTAEVYRVQKVTGLESSKDVYHLELSLEGSGLQYQPGDALGVWAPNDPDLVGHILERLGINPSEPVQVDGQELTARAALIEHREITRLSGDTVLGLAAAGGQSALETRYCGLPSDAQREFIEQRQLADLVDEYPARLEAQTLVELLRPLGPRSYSIASSQQLVDEEVHLTVATLYSDAIGVQRHGVASRFLNHRLGPGGQVRVYLEPNRRFRLPENPDTPIIMIASGTGIAPYRAFMQELENGRASPDSWLIFGNPHLRTDFLYQREWLRWRETGLLNRIDTAWSRDQDEKRYVQHVLGEQAERLNRWLQRGAHVYICGSLDMGQAVAEALQDALAKQRGLDPEAAAGAIADLRRDKRIQKDLY